MSVEASSAVGPPPGMRIRLSSNESALGPSPRAVDAAVVAVREGHLYPDDQAVELRQALAEHEGCSIEEVAVGTGSAALLMDLVAHEARGGGDVAAFERSFIVYRLAARNVGASYVEAPTLGPATSPRGGYQRDPDAMLKVVGERTRVVLLDNPGNPTGVHLTGDEVKYLVDELPDHVTVVVDEAYHHFATGHRSYQTVDELGLDHPRLLVMRTFSKAYGLAGLRVGYMTGPTELVRSLDAARARFNVTAAGQAGALAALADTVHMDATVAAATQGRQRLMEWLADQGVAHTPSLGNFVTIETAGPAAPVVAAFADRGIGVRPLLPYGMDQQLRVTVGRPAEVDEFLLAAGEVLAQ